MNDCIYCNNSHMAYTWQHDCDHHGDGGLTCGHSGTGSCHVCWARGSGGCHGDCYLQHNTHTHINNSPHLPASDTGSITALVQLIQHFAKHYTWPCKINLKLLTHFLGTWEYLLDQCLIIALIRMFKMCRYCLYKTMLLGSKSILRVI